MIDRVLKTERLVLRPTQMADAATITALASEFDVARMTARMPHPYAIGDARAWIGQMAESGETVFAITLTGQLIGCAGYTPLDGKRAEIGYWLGKPWWGQGFATEAARLGAAMPAIQRHGRWRSTKIVLEYIEAGRQFTDSAVNVLFEHRSNVKAEES